MAWWGWILFVLVSVVVLWFSWSIVAISNLKSRQQRAAQGKE